MLWTICHKLWPWRDWFDSSHHDQSAQEEKKRLTIALFDLMFPYYHFRPPRTRNSFIRNYHFILPHQESIRRRGSESIKLPRLFSWISFRRKTSLGHLKQKRGRCECVRVIAHSRIGGVITARSKRVPRLAMSEKGRWSHTMDRNERSDFIFLIHWDKSTQHVQAWQSLINY